MKIRSLKLIATPALLVWCKYKDEIVSSDTTAIEMLAPGVYQVTIAGDPTPYILSGVVAYARAEPLQTPGHTEPEAKPAARSKPAKQ